MSHPVSGIPGYRRIQAIAATNLDTSSVPVCLVPGSRNGSPGPFSSHPHRFTLPYVLVPRELSREEWIEKYSPKQDVESR
jgi:hypothetical protein